MRPFRTNPITPNSGQKPRPPLLASVPIPISSHRRAPMPPPSSPIRCHHSSTEDDLLFAMSPDQISPPTPFISRTISSYSEQLKLTSSSTRLQKFLSNQTIPHPFLDTKAAAYPEEPFMYSIPNINPISRPQTPKKKTFNSSTTAISTPTARRHALLRPFVSAKRPPRSSTTCSSSQTSEDESEVDTRCIKTAPLTSAFSRSASTATSATTSSSANSSVDALLTTAASSYPLCMSDDIVPVPLLSPSHFSSSSSGDRKKHRRANTGFFDRMRGALPSPPQSRDRIDEKHSLYAGEERASKSSSCGLDKYLREVDTRAERTQDAKSETGVIQVTRGRPRERKISRGVKVTEVSVLGSKDL